MSNDVIKILQFGFLLVTIWATIQSWWSAKRTETVHPLKAFILLWIYHISHLLWVWVLWIGVQWWQGELNTIQGLSMLAIASFLIYARFIEPFTIVVKHHQIRIDEDLPLAQPIKIALIADLHVGLYSGHEKQLKLLVEKVNQADPEMLIMSGDWTYEPENKLREELAILQQIRCPIYAVNGNHDEQVPGPPIQTLLADALKQNNIVNIENKIIEHKDLRILGVGDLWAEKTDMQHLPELPQDRPWLIVAHNPDSVALVPKLPSRPLMLSGHTHGGQIELPWITSYVMKKVSILGYKKGLYHHDHANVFVTAGVGMVGIPLRFCVPPTVEIIELS
ncbi:MULTISPECIES: metallophosphoesterase [unclassified Acinetobacter]|uniref:metallophosphoesterase n=1 Tax=unclassified Acinetobacter TaxID=196816 RepID=UPI0035B8C4F6